MSTTEVVDALASQLLTSGLSESEEEARCVAEACLVDENGDDSGGGDAAAPGGTTSADDSTAAACAAALREYFPDLTEREASNMARKSLGLGDESLASGHDSGEDESEEASSSVLSDDDGDDDGEYIGEGECELCERAIRLTRHHLIPKSTWPKIRTRLLRAADAISKGDAEKTRKLLGDADFDGLEGQDVTRDFVRRYMSRTCDICRPCHDAVHTLHGEMELAERYNTVEKLLTDENVVKFCKWANKQRPGKYAVR